jgi:hypothetical protein
MKYVPLLKLEGDLTTKSIIEAVLRYPGEKGIQFDEMRKRDRIWDAMDASSDPVGFALEDADHELLARLVKAFPFGSASRDLSKLLASIVDAKAPPAPLRPAKNGHHKEQPSAN